MPKKLRMSLLIVLAVTHVATAQASLFGPSIEKLEPMQRQERLLNQPLVVVRGNGQEGIAVHTKGAAIASLVVGFLAGSAMASSGAPQPGQSAHAYMQQQQQFMQAGMQVSQDVSQATNSAMNTSAAKNLENHAFQGPAEAVRTLLAEQLFNQLKSTPMAVAKADDNKEPRYVLSVNQNVWLLDFHLADSLYDLKYNIQTRIYDRQEDTYVLSQSCEGTLPDAQELEAWQADSQAKLFKAMESVSYQCANQVLSSLSMKQLELPSATAVPASPSQQVPTSTTQSKEAPSTNPATGVPADSGKSPDGSTAVSPLVLEPTPHNTVATQAENTNRGNKL